MSTDISTDVSTDISRSIYRPCVDRYVDRHIGRVSVDMSTDTSVECRSIYRPIHWSRGAQNTHDPNELSQMKRNNEVNQIKIKSEGSGI